MAFGAPTKIWKLNLDLVKGGTRGWDYAVTEASLDYGSRVVSTCLINKVTKYIMILDLCL